MEKEGSENNIFVDFYRTGVPDFNRWRQDNPNEYDEDTNTWSNTVNFSGVNFAELAVDNRIIFSRWDFGNGADFSNVSFIGLEVFFENCQFGEYIDFSNIKLGSATIFRECAFVGKVHFKSAKIENFSLIQSRLNGGSNSQGITFEECEFMGDNSNFSGTQFEETCRNIDFICCDFLSRETNFNNTHFLCACKFFKCNFFKKANFQGATFNYKSTFIDCTFRESLLFYGSSNSLIPSFQSCEFYSDFNITGRSLNSDFAGSIFHELPAFSTNSPDIEKLNLTDVKFKIVNKSKTNWPFEFTSDRSKLLTLRTLRGVAEKTKNHDLERDLYIEERKAERGVYLKEFWEKTWKGSLVSRADYAARLIVHFLMIVVICVYWISSNYGRSITRPIFWWLLSFFAFKETDKVIFSTVIHGSKLQPADIEKFNRIVDNLALANQIPIVGNLSIEPTARQFVYCGGDIITKQVCLPPLGYEPLMIFQNLFSGLLIFLFGLAIRNYFKIK